MVVGVTPQAPASDNPQPMQAAIAVGRFGLGARPGELDLAAGDPRGWLKAQIVRTGADQPQTAPGEEPLASSADRFRTYRSDQMTIRQEKVDLRAAGDANSTVADQIKAERKAVLTPLRDGVREEILARARLGATTDTPFRERWALFWANHFTVSTTKGATAFLAGPFEREAIRPHVFGRFEDLLVASTTHPGMLRYLDQERSAGPNSLAGQRRHLGLNENLGREVMELHTVGADAGYTQADVTEFARALTGYSIGGPNDGPDEGVFVYRPNLHEPGMRTVMGRIYADTGQGQARAILADLASSPHTADHIARKLAIHFVSDKPDPALTARLQQAYLKSNGDLAVVAAALIDAPEAWRPAPGKFKRPYELLLSSYRAVGATPVHVDQEVIGPLTRLGDRPFAAPQPNGWSEDAGDWTGPDAVVERLSWSAGFAAGHAPVDRAPVQVADAALGARLTPPVRIAIARAETRPEALTLLLMSPEFQRR